MLGKHFLENICGMDFQRGVEMELKEIEGVLKRPKLQNVKGASGLLGLTGYY